MIIKNVKLMSWGEDGDITYPREMIGTMQEPLPVVKSTNKKTKKNASKKK